MWVNDYIGLPFRWNGYERDGIGCWGLVAMVLKDQFGLDVPRFDDMAELMDAGRVPDRPTIPRWSSVRKGEERSGDILQMKGVLRGRAHDLHVGVIVEPGKVLHIEEDAGSVVIDYRIQKHAWRYIEAWRHA